MRLLLLFITIIFLGSCERETPKIKMNRTEKKIVDSLYKEGITVLAKEMDSICVAYKNKNYQQIKDSIIAIRLSEIEEILPE